MIELTWVSDVLKAVGLLYWLLAIGALIAAGKWGKGRIGKPVAIFAVLVLFGYLPVTQGVRNHAADQFRAEAFARFNKYCAEKAGIKIYKQLSGVNNVVLLRSRLREESRDQFLLDDPYGRRDDMVSVLDGRADPEWVKRTNNAFEYFESKEINAAGSPIYFETRLIRPPPEAADQSYRLQRIPIDAIKSRYGIDWEDISTITDRQYWLAASALRIVDLKSQEVVAERIGFMIDPGFGNTSGGRNPWSSARSHSCPDIYKGGGLYRTRRLLMDVFQPTFIELNHAK